MLIPCFGISSYLQESGGIISPRWCTACLFICHNRWLCFQKVCGKLILQARVRKGTSHRIRGKANLSLQHCQPVQSITPEPALMVGITQNWRISARGDITPCLTLPVPLQIGLHQAAPLPGLLQVGATDLLEDFGERVLGAEAELTSACQPSSRCLSRWPWAHAISSTLGKPPLQQGLLDQPTSQVFGEASLPDDLWLSQHGICARREQDLWKGSSVQTPEPSEVADAPRMAAFKGHLDSMISAGLFQLNHSVLFYLTRRHLSECSDAGMIEFSFAVLIVTVWLPTYSLKWG